MIEHIQRSLDCLPSPTDYHFSFLIYPIFSFERENPPISPLYSKRGITLKYCSSPYFLRVTVSAGEVNRGCLLHPMLTTAPCWQTLELLLVVSIMTKYLRACVISYSCHCAFVNIPLWKKS